jgi:hypothetical protein
MKIDDITEVDEPKTYTGMGCIVYEPNGITLQDARENLNKNLYDRDDWSGMSDMDYLNQALGKYPNFFDETLFKTLY